MALAGRLRSSLSLAQRILRAEPVSAQRAAPSSATSEDLKPPPEKKRSQPDQEASVPLGDDISKTKFLRNYATASQPKESKTKVPLAMFGVSGNYASALYLSAVKANSLDKVEFEILDLVEASKKSPTFSQFIKDLSVPAETRVKAINEICAEAKVSDITKNFLAVLAENGRLKHIENIAKRFVELTMAHRKEVRAIVTTVIPLPPQEEKELKETLQDIIGEGKTVKLEQKIDPSILGGLVVEFGQKVFDMSIKTRARQMERFLREPINFDSL